MSLSYATTNELTIIEVYFPKLNWLRQLNGTPRMSTLQKFKEYTLIQTGDMLLKLCVILDNVIQQVVQLRKVNKWLRRKCSISQREICDSIRTLHLANILDAKDNAYLDFFGKRVPFTDLGPLSVNKFR